MAKDKPTPATGKDEQAFGGRSLLDRLGGSKPVIDMSTEEPKPKAKPPKRQTAKALKQKNDPEPTGEGATLKVSVYLTQNDLDGLDQQVIASRRTTGKKRDRSELIREAVRVWLKAQR